MIFRISLIVFLFISTSFASKLEKVSLQLNWKYQFEYAGFIAAKEKGFYKEVGLDVSLLEKEARRDLIDGLLNDDYTFLVTSSQFFLHEKANTSLMFLANYFKQSPLALVSQNDILSLYSLKNKKVAISKASLNDDSLSLMLDKFHINKESIKRVDSSNPIEDFVNKKVDAMAVFTSNEIYELNKRNINFNTFYPANYGLNAPDVNLISTRKTFNNRKEMVRKFISASNKGWEYALKNSDEVINIIYDKYSKEKDLGALKYESKIVKELVLEDIYAIGSIDLEFFSSYFNYLRDDRNINYSIQNIIYSPKYLELTKDEKNWLSKKENIEVVIDNSNAPYVFYNENKKTYEGLLIDYLKAIEKVSNLKFTYKINKNFNSKHSRVKIVDIPSISIIKKGLKYIVSSSELSTKKVVTDSYIVYIALKRDYPIMDIIYIKNYEKSLKMIKSGERDIFLTNLISSKYWTVKKDEKDIQIIHNGRYDIPYFIELNEVLDRNGLSVLKKSIKKISQNKKLEIYSKWTLSNQAKSFDYTLLYKVAASIGFIILFVIVWNINLKRKVNEKTNEINELMKNLEEKVQQRTKSLNEVKTDLEELLGKTMSSIKYASFIQHAIIPKTEEVKKSYDDSFVIWEPKDIVGGDIYLFETLKTQDESLLLVIDCTGHGVPGAFVTMLVKAVEREIVALIKSSNSEVSPAKILKHFDNALKELLKKEKGIASLETGFDGGVLYYNKKQNYIKYAGAKTPLFYIKDGELYSLKSTRASIGYKTSHLKDEFDEHKIVIDEDTYIYITTDGYLDQTGGQKGFSFGKKRFAQLLEQNYKRSFSLQKEILLNRIKEYKKDEAQDDDMLVIGLKVSQSKDDKNVASSELNYNI